MEGNHVNSNNCFISCWGNSDPDREFKVATPVGVEHLFARQVSGAFMGWRGRRISGGSGWDELLVPHKDKDQDNVLGPINDVGHLNLPSDHRVIDYFVSGLGRALTTLSGMDKCECTR